MSAYLEMILARGSGMITCGNHLGVFVSDPENIAGTPPGWIFVPNTDLTIEVLREAVDTAKKGRENWPTKANIPEAIQKPQNQKKKKH